MTKKLQFFDRKTFDFFPWTCYSIDDKRKKALTKTVRHVWFSESWRLVRANSCRSKYQSLPSRKAESISRFSRALPLQR